MSLILMVVPHQMSTHTANQPVRADPKHVLDVLTDPRACNRWSPIKFTADLAPGERLAAGSTTALRGRIAGRGVRFQVEVAAASENGLSLTAEGPILLDVSYRLSSTRRGTLIAAEITLSSTRGISATLVARATNALLTAGVLRFALRAIATEAERLQHISGRRADPVRCLCAV